jgi:serine/threonine protein kinase
LSADILLCGQSPWKSPPTEANKLLQDIINCRWDFDKEEWKYVSPEAKDFISRLLRKEPSERMTAAQCLAHPWLQPSGSKVGSHSNKQLNNTLTRLKDFTYGRKTAKSLLDLFDPPSANKDDEKT